MAILAVPWPNAAPHGRERHGLMKNGPGAASRAIVFLVLAAYSCSKLSRPSSFHRDGAWPGRRRTR